MIDINQKNEIRHEKPLIKEIRKKFVKNTNLEYFSWRYT